MHKLKVGDKIHGYVHGLFGQDSYACRVVEGVGKDWIVTRNTNDDLELATGPTLYSLPHFKDDESWCQGTCKEALAEVGQWG